MKTKQKITKSKFMSALMNYADQEGYSYDEWDREMIWQGFVNNQPRKNDDRFGAKTEQEIWMEILQPYLCNDESKEEFVEVGS